MNLYGSLFDSMLECCGRTWLRHGPLYTVCMLALGLAVCLNLLSIIDLLWVAGIVDNPYRSAGQLHPQRYIYALLCAVLYANAILARRHFSTDHFSSEAPPLSLLPHGTSLRAAPVYVLGSAAVFLSTLSIDMMVA